MTAVAGFVIGFVLGYLFFRQIMVALGCAVLAAVGTVAFLAWDHEQKQAEDEAQRGAPRKAVPRSLIGTWEGEVSDRGKLRVTVKAGERGSVVAEIWNPEELFECVEVGTLEKAYENRIVVDAAPMRGTDAKCETHYELTVTGEGRAELDSPDTYATLTRVTPVPGPSVPAIAGAWRGTYTCGQGKTGMTLTIKSAGGSRITAVFTFYPLRSNPDVARGSSAKKGIYRAGRLTLQHDHWIDEPRDYRGVGLSAEIKGSAPSEITGTLHGVNCTTFTVTKQP